jgi:hypothetical protein
LVHAGAIMMRMPVLIAALLIVACATTTTTTTTTLKPSRPTRNAGPPLTDPPLQRAHLHIAISGDGLGKLLDAVVPLRDRGDYALLGAREYRWNRQPFVVAFDDAKKQIALRTDVSADVDVPGTTIEALPLRVSIRAQPVLSAQHRLLLQAVEVTITTEDKRVKVAGWAGLLEHLEAALADTLVATQVDLTPPLQSLHDKLQAPLFLPLGDASACLSLDVRGLEAGPMAMAGGVERDLSLVLAPGLTMPCTIADANGTLKTIQRDETVSSSPLPSLFNVSSVPSGPFSLTVPVAAGYDELQLAMMGAFPEGRLYFSTDHPRLYLTDPQVYASGGAVVVRVKLAGTVDAALSMALAGELFLVGTPQLRDNFIEFPDLQPTVESSQALLGLAFSFKQAAITDAVRDALKIDLSERLSSVKQKLVTAMASEHELVKGAPSLCMKANIGRLSLHDLQAHDAYLRVYADTTAYVSAELPCRK